jgi:hypothetical protein
MCVHVGVSCHQEEDALTVFYSCMYRASRYPRRLSEIDASGAEVHWCVNPSFPLPLSLPLPLASPTSYHCTRWLSFFRPAASPL